MKVQTRIHSFYDVCVCVCVETTHHTHGKVCVCIVSQLRLPARNALFTCPDLLAAHSQP